MLTARRIGAPEQRIMGEQEGGKTGDVRRGLTFAFKPDFSAMVVTVNGSAINYGLFLNALISFLLVAAAIYFFVIAPMNAYVARARRGEAPPDPTSKKCPECLSDIPIAARRCAFCTTALQA